MKKVLATILALVMALGLTATTWATEGGTEGARARHPGIFIRTRRMNTCGISRTSKV